MDDETHFMFYISLYMFVVDLGRFRSRQESWHPRHSSQSGNSKYMCTHLEIGHAVIALFFMLFHNSLNDI